MLVRPNEICVIPRGVRYRVEVVGEEGVRGYGLELYQGHFQLPELGALGSNGLANARDFQAPVASFEEGKGEWELVSKFDGKLFVARQGHTPFDVVGWHGLYYPYKYDLGRFNVIGSVSDGSLFCILLFLKIRGLAGCLNHSGNRELIFV